MPEGTPTFKRIASFLISTRRKYADYGAALERYYHMTVISERQYKEYLVTTALCDQIGPMLKNCCCS